MKNDYVVVVTSMEHTNIAIEFNIPHDRAADVIHYLTQFTHNIKRASRKPIETIDTTCALEE